MAEVRGKLRVLIATTAGPVEVQRLTEEDPALGRSVVCVDGTTAIAGIAAEYQAFVASPTGVVERLYGHPCYRLDVSKAIDVGSSWQLAAFAAHALHAADRLAQEGETSDTVLLATGSVRATDLTVRDVSHVNNKIEQALDALRAEHAAGREALIAVPAGNLPEVTDELRSRLDAAGIRLMAVENLGALARELALRLPEPDLAHAGYAAAPPAAARPRVLARFRPWMVATFGVLAVIAGLLAAHRLGSVPTGEPVVAGSRLFDGQWEMVGQGSEICALKAWTAKIVVVGGWIPASRPEKGFVRATGEFRFTFPARVDPLRTNEFSGRLFGSTGKGEYRTIGGECAGTFTLKRVEG